MRFLGGLATLLAVTVLVSCGRAAQLPGWRPDHPATPVPAEVTAPAVPAPAATPAPGASTPAPIFAGSIALAPAARVRSGPGLDMPVIDLDPVGTRETFDGWFTRADDTPMTDAVTGRIEAWSRDWYRLTDGRGWVHAGAVSGLPPAGLPQVAWSRPASAPAPAAGIVSIALDRQDQAATCEVASLKMALTHQGISTSEQQLLELIGVDDGPPVVDAGGRIVRWGNPSRAFVGDPGGHPSQHTAYGVYDGPVARATERLGGVVLAAGAVDAQALYRYVIAGHPAVAWVTYDYTRDTLTTWTSWDGATVPYSLKEHAALVIGVTPTRVLINDPWSGQVWKTRAAFEAAYATFGGRSVVTQ
jgi:uncharacterized protein YvpB